MVTLQPSINSQTELSVLNGLHLLLVEDDHDTRELFAFILESSGATVVTADSVEGALEAFAQFQPHLLISDIRLQDGNGHNLILKIREIEVLHGRDHLPAIAITGFSKEIDSHKLSPVGFQDYLVKPVSPNDLIAAVAKLVAVRA